ncbi:LPXTG-motif cell wall anchor domain protein [Cellulomonas flavigena DSM 20109]|uniref:LPXTG-motif cell wall anchor domain protein n=1 Tax=Cellulomonas flavigena (strain ATCC 482 / DSM 20109 / BCRC 11376 / JCM 18109 / NBRC 3775 / NCIMB 8073 / NRS 134) TaxID=446466 RepID=D5UFK5_CELFN|nr:SpaH/EbpB family LPXTG-anchored major pilin [Cellulomonas flavigena]ADG72964.1 LPXTG-motif cell wall anchor domain protein [Cellulomonas flavigena DSM 20109]
MSTSIIRRVTAAIGGLVLAAGAAMVAAAPAQAVTLPGNIDPAQPRSLTVHKFALGPANGQVAGTGQQLPSTAGLGTPLPGAVFTATLVAGVDLTTPEGWTIANSLTPQSASNRLTGTPYTSTPSAADGTATFPTGMPLGLYYVQETVLPADATNPSAPFLVSLPLPTGPSGAPANQWIYDVHVYPKNAVTETTKTRIPAPANSAEARNPDLIRWSISASIPTLAAGDTISTFTLTDIVPGALVFPATPPVGVSPSTVTVTNAGGVAQSFAEGDDYTITTTDATGTTDATSVLSFTTTGLTRLTALQGGLVSFDVLTRAVSIPPTGVITNTATANINGATETVTGSTPIGQLTVFAFESSGGGPRTPLAGAVYQVYLTQNDANNQQNPISINGTTSWTTGADGFVAIPIMTPGNYYVREITPPAGYNLPQSNPVQTVVVAGPTSTTAPVQNYVEFNHTQVSAANFLLPLTGGDAGRWFALAGSALLAIAVGAAVVVTRRRALSAPASA